MGSIQLNKKTLNVVMLNTAYLNGGDVILKDKGKEYIKFEDPEVLRVLLANGIGDGVGITKTDASKVKSLNSWFKENTTIKTFDELKYFTSITSIDSEIFASSSIQRFTLPKECNAIKSALCYNCRSLAKVTGLESLEELSGYAVFIRTALEEINLPNIIRIYNLCFMECNNLVKVELGNKVSFIDHDVFNGCGKLTNFIVKATIPPSINGNVFYKSSNVSIYVPDASVEAYKTATGWIEYADKIKSINQYPGFVIINNIKLEQNGTTSKDNIMSTIGYVDCQPNTQITWGINGGLGRLVEYNENLITVDYWEPRANPRTIPISNTTTKLKASFETANLDNAYIYDETNGVYLWKGKNV